jgi:hypothetical protein
MPGDQDANLPIAAGQAAEEIKATLLQALGILRKMPASAVQNDEQFTTHVIGPAYVGVLTAHNAIATSFPQFQQRFRNAMLAVRAELLVPEGNKFRLCDDAEQRLPQVVAAQLTSTLL